MSTAKPSYIVTPNVKLTITIGSHHRIKTEFNAERWKQRNKLNGHC